jgi:hypothetical protein|tara:strand:+ start:591 stop:782 length:192 start_codon:yes stop_codon:yes gene_type:complete
MVAEKSLFLMMVLAEAIFMPPNPLAAQYSMTNSCTPDALTGQILMPAGGRLDQSIGNRHPWLK